MPPLPVGHCAERSLLSAFAESLAMWSERDTRRVGDMFGGEIDNFDDFLRLVGAAVMLWQDKATWHRFVLDHSETDVKGTRQPATFDEAFEVVLTDCIRATY